MGIILWHVLRHFIVMALFMLSMAEPEKKFKAWRKRRHETRVRKRTGIQVES